jgi:hypothetical protein
MYKFNILYIIISIDIECKSPKIQSKYIKNSIKNHFKKWIKKNILIFK